MVEGRLTVTYSTFVKMGKTSLETVNPWEVLISPCADTGVNPLRVLAVFTVDRKGDE